GDIVCVCGSLGVAERGLKDYYEALAANKKADTTAFKALCEPQPKVFEGQILGKLGVLSMMDISDGLALSLHDLAEQNGCGFSVDRSLIPTDDAAGINFETAFYGAGDFGLLYVCSPATYEKIVCGSPESDSLSLGYKIGVVTCEKGVSVDGSIVENRGYLHSWQ
ncbi:MAG: hypothetical protein J6X83_03840, partial [Methanomicrobium sp.]|nr:hypothetical protein [Methanomicrobium sp.]